MCGALQSRRSSGLKILYRLWHGDNGGSHDMEVVACTLVVAIDHM